MSYIDPSLRQECSTLPWNPGIPRQWCPVPPRPSGCLLLSCSLLGSRPYCFPVTTLGLQPTAADWQHTMTCRLLELAEFHFPTCLTVRHSVRVEKAYWVLAITEFQYHAHTTNLHFGGSRSLWTNRIDSIRHSIDYMQSGQKLSVQRFLQSFG